MEKTQRQIVMAKSPLDQLKLDGTDDPGTVSIYTALTVKQIFETLHGNGKPGLCERQDRTERRFIYFAGAFAGVMVILNIMLQILF